MLLFIVLFVHLFASFGSQERDGDLVSENQHLVVRSMTVHLRTSGEGSGDTVPIEVQMLDENASNISFVR